MAYEHLVNCSDDWRPTANARRPSKLLNGVEISRDSTETGSFFFVVNFIYAFQRTSINMVISRKLRLHELVKTNGWHRPDTARMWWVGDRSGTRSWKVYYGLYLIGIVGSESHEEEAVFVVCRLFDWCLVVRLLAHGQQSSKEREQFLPSSCFSPSVCTYEQRRPKLELARI